MNNNFRTQIRRFGPMVIGISGIILVILSLVACALSAQRHKTSAKDPPSPIVKEQPLVSTLGPSNTPPEPSLSIREFEYGGTDYILIEKEGSSSFSVILK